MKVSKLTKGSQNLQNYRQNHRHNDRIAYCLRRRYRREEVYKISTGDGAVTGEVSLRGSSSTSRRVSVVRLYMSHIDAVM